LLHFLQLRRIDLRERILLAVHHAGLQRGEKLRKLHRARIGAICLEHLDAPLALGHAQLDPLQIGGQLDRPLVVRDVAHAVFPDGEHLEPLLLDRGLDHRPEYFLFDAAHVCAVLDDVVHLENAGDVDLGAHHRRRERHVERTELELLDHLLVAAQLARPVDDHLRLAGKLRVGALREFIRAFLENRAGLTDVAELDFGLRDGGRGDEPRADAGDDDERGTPRRAKRSRDATFHAVLLQGSGHTIHNVSARSQGELHGRFYNPGRRAAFAGGECERHGSTLVSPTNVHPLVFHPRGDDPQWQRLRGAVSGALLTDAASRGRYATDASIYQVEPLAVLVPESDDDVRAAIDVCAELRIPVLPRGAGSSQCGQTVGAALVIDHSKHLNRIVAFDADAQTITVEPGIVLDALNAWLSRHALWFPVDVSTSAQCTLGGMAGNNSCGSRSLRYGNMVHNVVAIDARLSDGTEARFGPERAMHEAPARVHDLIASLRELGLRERDEIERVVPKLLRRVGGYNADIFHLQCAPLPRHRALGVVNFESLYRAMDATRHLVELGPSAVELVDRTMIDLARDNPAFRPVIERALIGEPQAILLVEFIGDDEQAVTRKLDDLAGLL